MGSHDYNAVHRLRDLDAIERSGRENLAIPSLDEFYDALFKVGEARQISDSGMDFRCCIRSVHFRRLFSTRVNAAGNH